MTDIRFYHLTRKTLEQALPEMLEKTLARGLKAVVMAG
jgi:DNA polymerase-3 subunit chi